MDEQNQQILPPQQPSIPPQNLNPVPPPQQRTWLKPVLIALIILPLIWFVFQASALFFFLNPSSTIKKAEEFKRKNQVPTFFPTPTPDETANWKTYTNTKYKFSFMYPPELKISSSSGEFDNGLGLDLEQNNYGMPRMEILLYTGEYAKRNQTDLNTILSVKKLNNYNYSQITTNKISGQTLYSYIETFDSSSGKLAPVGGPLSRLAALGIINNVSYNINYTYAEETLKKDWKTFNQILSTFRFTQ